jgi:predicted DNA-binding transcriptional regulator AlpA
MSATTAYRLRQLASTKTQPGLLPVSQATIWRWVKAGKFPKPFTMGSRCTVWDAAEVDAWIANSKANGLPTADTTATTKEPHRKVVHLHAGAGEGAS